MIFNSKQTVDGTPVWEVDTDTQTVRHRSPKTGKTERYVFHTDQIRYYLHQISDPISCMRSLTRARFTSTWTSLIQRSQTQ